MIKKNLSKKNSDVSFIDFFSYSIQKEFRYSSSLQIKWEDVYGLLLEQDKSDIEQQPSFCDRK